MHKHHVLVIDNSDDDLLLARCAFKKVAPEIGLTTLESGAEGIRYVAGEGLYANREKYPFPRLVIIDLKMPEVTGFDVLSALKKMHPDEPPFLVVMSSSALEEDITKAMALGASAFHTKPVNIEELNRVVSKLCSFFCKQHLPGETQNDSTQPSS